MKKTILIILISISYLLPYAQPNMKIDVTNRDVLIYTTAENTEYRLTRTNALPFSYYGQPFENQPCIFVDPSRLFQTFVGIGGALTDASAETFAQLSPETQEAFLTAYFSKTEGIGYSIIRTNINSCDFSSGSYTYVDDNDTALASFTIAHDEQYKIPMIKRALVAAGGRLPLFVSPWSPPAWMKDNNNMLQGGKLLPAFYQSWANYYVKFIQAYENLGIPIWGLTVQNEPMAKQTWESCMYTAEEERDFIKKYLGPTLRANGLQDKNLIAWDHNRDLMYHRASCILGDTATAKYVWGLGFHWYESWTGAPIPENVKRVAEAWPKKYLLLTEACNYPFSWLTFNQWHWGENYGSAMINDFNNGSSGWTDWNILLDENGGPNHVKNFCFAPVHADTRKDTLYFMNSYYYIGHFSKFIHTGARRIACSSSRAQLITTGFRNQDGSVAVIVMNQGDTEIRYRFYVDEMAIETTSLPHSITTLVF
ncbi:MAG TPA: glycoside hydrolase family 30 protein [Bacteroidales bacterium]|nr:glycoside hydrolase family 30 protein [Bacteroidales bacterium]